MEPSPPEGLLINNVILRLMSRDLSFVLKEQRETRSENPTAIWLKPDLPDRQHFPERCRRSCIGC